MFSKNWSLCLPLVAGLGLVACEGEEGRQIYTTYPDTIWVKLQTQSELSKFVELGQKAGVNVFLDNTQATFTLIAPSNSAFSGAQVSDDALEVNKLLRFHMLAGWIDTALLKLGGEFNTITSTSVRVEVEGSTYTVFDHTGASAKFTTTDVFCKNGVIHIIDKVLSPPPEPRCGDGTMDAGEACDDGNTANGDGCSAMCMTETTLGNLAMVLAAGGFTSLTGAVDGTPVEDRLTGAAESTVFAPNNAAFTAFGSLTGVNAAVTANVLLHHVVDGKKAGADLTANLVSLAGLPLVVVANPTTVGGAPVGMKDIAASNGVAHELTAVIKPPTALEYITANMHTQRTGQAAVTAMASVAALDPDVLGAGHAAPITIFAPSNEAWMDAGLDPMDGTITATIANVLLTHATRNQVLLPTADGDTMITMLSGSMATLHKAGAAITLTIGGVTVTVEAANSDKRTLTGAVHVVDALLDTDATPNP